MFHLLGYQVQCSTGDPICRDAISSLLLIDTPLSVIQGITLVPFALALN